MKIKKYIRGILATMVAFSIASTTNVIKISAEEKFDKNLEIADSNHHEKNIDEVYSEITQEQTETPQNKNAHKYTGEKTEITKNTSSNHSKRIR